jgi:Fe2+ or Zn2+ uptake regulation protein
MNPEVVKRLEALGIQPSAQRVAIAEYVLHTDQHPAADEVWAVVGKRLFISRATVYNTLNLFADKGLVRALVLAEGRVVYDPLLGPHHHFIDEDSGAIHDVPWDAVRVSDVDGLRSSGYDVREYQVVMRGRRRPAKSAASFAAPAASRAGRKVPAAVRPSRVPTAASKPRGG